MTTLPLKKIRNLTKLDFKLFYPFLVHIKEKDFSFPATTYKYGQFINKKVIIDYINNFNIFNATG